MRIARVKVAGGHIHLARVHDDKVSLLDPVPAIPGIDPLRVCLTEGADLASMETETTLALSEVELLAPVSSPQKIIAIGLNYADHAREAGLEPPPAPVAFAKLPSSIIGPARPISFRSADSSEVDYEAELAVVMGRRARDVTEAQALDHVFGYTACNDVSARDAQFADGQWIRGKSYDTFCPLGPWVVTADEVGDPQDLAIRCRLNGELVQDSTTGEMIFGVAEIISYLSRFMTLEPGDVIATGTPFGVGFARTPPLYLQDGDVVEIEIEGIGVLGNPVVVDG